MELRIPTLEQLRPVYDRALRTRGGTAPGASLTGTTSPARHFYGWATPAGPCWTICAWPQTAGTAAWAP